MKLILDTHIHEIAKLKYIVKHKYRKLVEASEKVERRDTFARYTVSRGKRIYLEVTYTKYVIIKTIYALSN